MSTIDKIQNTLLYPLSSPKVLAAILAHMSLLSEGNETALASPFLHSTHVVAAAAAAAPIRPLRAAVAAAATSNSDLSAAAMTTVAARGASSSGIGSEHGRLDERRESNEVKGCAALLRSHCLFSDVPLRPSSRIFGALATRGGAILNVFILSVRAEVCGTGMQKQPPQTARVCSFTRAVP